MHGTNAMQRYRVSNMASTKTPAKNSWHSLCIHQAIFFWTALSCHGCKVRQVIAMNNSSIQRRSTWRARAFAALRPAAKEPGPLFPGRREPGVRAVLSQPRLANRDPVGKAGLAQDRT
eukprot:75297-Chlamydomonas_euryale.AAC.7